jgi:peptidoglycan/LPS O-acetylase OafA/YrhL
MGGTFSVGILLAIIGASSVRFPAPAKYAAFVVGIMMSLSVIVISFVLAMGNHPGLGFFAAVFFDHLGGLGVALLFLSCLLGISSGVHGFVSSKPIVMLSALAYAIYLFHVPIINSVYYLTHGPRYGDHPTLAYYIEFFGLNAIAIGIVAFAMHTWVEEPFLKRKDRLRENV